MPNSVGAYTWCLKHFCTNSIGPTYFLIKNKLKKSILEKSFSS